MVPPPFIAEGVEALWWKKWYSPGGRNATYLHPSWKEWYTQLKKARIGASLLKECCTPGEGRPAGIRPSDAIEAFSFQMFPELQKMSKVARPSTPTLPSQQIIRNLLVQGH
jgi:hypothetical protein